ncbi:C4-dicarboxylate ABC transporter [Nocardioides anomalus]|uniref:C4-dicarboxylate ABC transporter n=1 Tax=Nocardioides anomalus TaxID=2712223 RepID=A0A6G6WIQ7_9ACTN|nr:C4-dicarboxylate ABC transporter [Nocardioides anomalus]QIG45102.1 C4-dicarboxylate ABC transporter [Nocardioides anomalus]
MRRFTMVMGTGIVANAAASLPVHPPLLLDAARVVWALAALLLVALLVRPVRWERTPFLGAPAMALMTVGTGAVLLEVPLRPVGVALWLTGAVLGVVSAVSVPRPERLSAVWLLPVVPPMVAAATGTVVSPRLAPVGLGLFGLALVRAAPVLLAVARGWRAEPEVPLLWIPLGILGQSVTAAAHLGVPLWGPPVLALGLAWLALVAVRTLVRRPAFSPAWWSFTFPLGTLVTGSSALGLTALAVSLYAGLVAAWAVVGTAQLRAYSSTKRASTLGGSVTATALERSTTASAWSGSK